MLRSILKHKLAPVFLIMIVAFMFYSVRLTQTMELASDFGRDALRALEFWQNKEVTFVGAPLGVSTSPHHKIFFSSISIYLGMLGLPLADFSPIGTVFINILLTTISIFFFYLIASKMLQDRRAAVISTLLYALSPLTVFQTRLFWTPNIIIPLSVFFWYIFFNLDKKYNILAGLLAGVMFLIHYMVVIPFSLFMLLLLGKKRVGEFVRLGLGFFVGIIPLLFFELRNGFYTFNSILIYLKDGSMLADTFDSGPIIDRLMTGPLTILGLRSAELNIPSFFDMSTFISVMSLIFAVVMLCVSLKLFKNNKFTYHTLLIPLTLFVLLITKNLVNMRYQFFTFPLIILYLTQIITYFRPRYYLFLLIFIFAADFKIVSMTRVYDGFSIPLTTLQNISDRIGSEPIEGSYNVTESVTGDARASSIRYYVTKDLEKKPKPPEDYYNLGTLFILTRLDQDLGEVSTWEFTATPNLEVTQTWEVDGLILYKLVSSK